MRTKIKLPTYPIPVWVQISGIVGALVVLAGFLVWFLPGHNFAVFNPAGHVASRERRLIFITLSLALIVVIPVFALLIGFAWKYRETNKTAKYSPELDGNRFAETIWWLVPTAIIGVMCVITWQSTHELDPSKALVSSNKPLTIQVVALQWKWLFIYPQQHVASVNFAELPVNTPINFQITSDAPMNSFWIPQLGGQIYAMNGMSMPLQLEASKAGDYRGESANISGTGFANMDFTARAASSDSFANWVDSVRQSSAQLDIAAYNNLAKPDPKPSPIVSYTAVNNDLYDVILMKYMMPGMTDSRGDIVAAVAEGAGL